MTVQLDLIGKLIQFLAEPLTPNTAITKGLAMLVIAGIWALYRKG